MFVTAARFNGQDGKLGWDSLAALNLMRKGSVPPGTVIKPGGPSLHGVGEAECSGMVDVDVEVGGIMFQRLRFGVVNSLPVPALMGKPSMEQMGTVLDLARDEARIIKGKKAATVRAVAVPVQKDSQRPRAQSYWNWLAKRMAKAPKSVQIKFQDVMERADDQMLAKFLDEFPTWALSQRQMSGEDNPTVHPAPYREELKRPGTMKVSGAVVCPITVDAGDILGMSEETARAEIRGDDNRDFLPPVMTPEEDAATVKRELVRLVEEAEISEAGKKKLAVLLEKHKAAFGMQLKKVDMTKEKVKIHLTGIPKHQPRRPIKDPRVSAAQRMWEEAMIGRGGVGEFSGDREKARPVNIHHVIRNMKIRFTGDMRTWNDVTLEDAFPVPSPLEALSRFRRNRIFSTFDETDSFFQYPLDEDSYIPFYSAKGGLRELRVVPQGGQNSHQGRCTTSRASNLGGLTLTGWRSCLMTHSWEHLELRRRCIWSCWTSSLATVWSMGPS